MTSQFDIQICSSYDENKIRQLPNGIFNNINPRPQSNQQSYRKVKEFIEIQDNQLDGWQHNHYKSHDDMLDDYYECLIECDTQQNECKRICREILY